MKFKMLSGFMAMMVLLTSFQVVMEQHFCKGELTDTSFYSSVETCMDKNVPMDDPSCDKPSCCQIHKITTPQVDYQKLLEDPVNHKIQNCTPLPLEPFRLKTESFESGNSDRRPPPSPGIYPSGWDLRISHQSFLL